MAPGVIDTEMSQGVREMAGDEVKARILLKRYGKPRGSRVRGVVPGVRLRDYVTGQVFHVDGGFKME